MAVHRSERSRAIWTYKDPGDSLSLRFRVLYWAIKDRFGYILDPYASFSFKQTLTSSLTLPHSSWPEGGFHPDEIKMQI